MDPSHYQNFAITDDAVIFFFGQGELLTVGRRGHLGVGAADVAPAAAALIGG